MRSYRSTPKQRCDGYRTARGARTTRAGWALRLVAVSAVACTSLGTAVLTAAANSGAGTTTLTFVNAQDPGTFDKVIAGFEKANPSIKIKLQTLPYDAMNAA